MLLTDLDTKSLLDIFSYLDLCDSINFAETCVRLREVAKLKFAQYKSFNMWRYLQQLKNLKASSSMVDIEKVLSHIGPHICVLTVALKQYENDFDLSEPIQKYCNNVKSLNVCSYYESVYSRWIQNLGLESLRLGCKELLKDKICDGITTLKEWRMGFFYDFDDHEFVFELNNVLEKNLNIEVLDIPLYKQFNYSIFANLNNLHHLGIDVQDARDLGKLIPYLKMDKLTKCQIGDWDHLDRYTDQLNQFLETLAEKARLNELTIKMCKRSIIESTLHTLNKFNLTGLFVTAPSNQNQQIENILVQVQPNLTRLNLGLREQGLDRILFLIKNLKKLELFHIWVCDAVINQLLNNEIIAGILHLSNNRPALTLHIRCYNRQHEVVITKFFFNWRGHQIIVRTNVNDFDDKTIPTCCRR